MARDDLIGERTGKLCGAFGHYVRVYDERVPFTGEQLAAHRECIRLRWEDGSVHAAVGDERFIQALQRTLRAWGIGVRASRLVPADDFVAALHAALPQLEDLEPRTIDGELPADIADRLWFLISSLGIVKNSAKIVAGTKTLHHLLPDLVVPMDRAWTGTFFRFHLPEWQDPASQRRIFGLAYADSLRSRGRFSLSSTSPAGAGGRAAPRSSTTRSSDSAKRNWVPPTDRMRSPQVGSRSTYRATLRPRMRRCPCWGQATVMRGVSACCWKPPGKRAESQPFVPMDDGPVTLDVVLRCPAGQNPADATNYLGGIADVLEEKSHRGPLEHLGALAAVRLYRNDRQIKHVAYREDESAHVGYTVTVRLLSSL